MNKENLLIKNYYVLDKEKKTWFNISRKTGDILSCICQDVVDIFTYKQLNSWIHRAKENKK